ncbi:PspC domain-containing protein [Sphaerotilaceae bacterium SBD11-9]
MSISDELNKLSELHQRGALSDDEFARAKARVVNGPGPALTAVNALQRSRSDRWFGGVCGGLARVTDVAPWLWRLAFALLLLCGGTGVFVYLLLWVMVPLEPASVYGEPHPGQAG